MEIKDVREEKVIVVTTKEGLGVTHNPFREVTRYYKKDGTLINILGQPLVGGTEDDLPLCPFHCVGCNRKVTYLHASGGGSGIAVLGIGNLDLMTCPSTVFCDTREEAAELWVKATQGLK